MLFSVRVMYQYSITGLVSSLADVNFTTSTGKMPMTNVHIHPTVRN